MRRRTGRIAAHIAFLLPFNSHGTSSGLLCDEYGRLILPTRSLILMFGMLLLPETPRFLIKKDNHDKAIKSLQFLRRLPADHPSLVGEYQEIKGNYEYELSLGSSSYLECFRGTIGKRTFTGIGIQCLQQLVSPSPSTSPFFHKLIAFRLASISSSTTELLTLLVRTACPALSSFRS